MEQVEFDKILKVILKIHRGMDDMPDEYQSKGVL